MPGDGHNKPSVGFFAVKALEAWGSPEFEDAFKAEIGALGAERLPLQAGLSQSSHVSGAEISVMILNVTETSALIRVKAGIIYAGINAGSCCADDPTPINEQTEYCEVQFEINKTTAEATVTVL